METIKSKSKKTTTKTTTAFAEQLSSLRGEIEMKSQQLQRDINDPTKNVVVVDAGRGNCE